MSKSIEIKKVAQLTGHKAAIYALAGTDTAAGFISGAGDGWVAQWNIDEAENGQLIAEAENHILALLPLEKEHKLLIGDMLGSLYWVDLKDSSKIRNISHHQKGIFDLMRIGDTIISIGGDGMLSKWNLEGQPLESIRLSNKSLRCMAYHPTRHELAIGASDHHIYLLDPSNLKVKKIMERAHENSVFSLAYHPTKALLLSGGRDALLRIWDINDEYNEIQKLNAHWFTINHIAFQPAGQYFATASRDKTIRIWDANKMVPIKTLDTINNGGHLNSVNRLYWSSYKNTLISCSDDRSIILWEIS